ncbi:hypothetical protein C8F01DRAFT_1374953 [Mycena amicta]|nr:hypothetical protein C8F01DRAFT_1374953 [Mycena amicta]
MSSRKGKRRPAAETYQIADSTGQSSSTSHSVLHQYTDARSDGRTTHSATIRRVVDARATDGPAVLLPDPPHPVSALDYEVHDLNETEYAREYRASDNPLQTWLNYHREDFLLELLRLEGRGDHRYTACRGCTVGTAAFRCTECVQGGLLLCRDCIVKQHASLPFHRIQEWNGTHFDMRTLKSLGLRVQLGHWHEAGSICGSPQPAYKDDFVVIDVNGVHEIGLDFCGCFSSGAQTTQLLRAGLYPATSKHPRTAATIRVLRHFHFAFVESKCSAYDFFNALAHLTDNTGLGGRDRYDEFLCMTKEWRNLQMLKRAGRGHDPTGITGTEPGECALLCPACPQPGKNLPADWEKCADDRRHLYALFLATDANFRLKRKDVSSEGKDPGLGSGLAFYNHPEPYMQHVKKHWNDKQARSQCVAHDAVDKPDRDARGTASSGIGAVDCARHNMKRPLSVGDLQLGERYINMDFLFLRSINGSDLVCFFVSYDIACQWHIHLWARMARYDNQLLNLDKNNKCFVFLVPKFHPPAHIEECNIRFSFNLTRHVGMTDGEAPERGWSITNPLAGSTMNMGPGTRRDALDAFFNDQNHKKIITLGATLLAKVKEAAPLMIQAIHAYLDLESGFRPETVATWMAMAEKWEAGASQQPNPFPNPFESKKKDAFLSGVRHQLAQETAHREAMQTEVAGAIRENMHVTELIAGGLQLEEQQRTLHADMAGMRVHATERQRASMLERTSKLRRKIFAWIDIQTQFFPSLERLRQQDNDARADVALSQGQAIPGIGVAEIKLWLPSAMRERAGSQSLSDGCTPEILRYEFRMRAGQAIESLNVIRRNLLVRTHLYNLKDRYTRGVKAHTRSNAKIKTVEERVRRAAAQYRAAWTALSILGRELQETEWSVELKELKADDLRGIPRAHFGDPARQRGGSHTTTGGTSEQQLEPEPDAKRSRRSHRLPLPLSWIWIQQTESRTVGAPETEDEALRIEWARTRARALRWTEELDLLEEEMRRIDQFLAWRADWWDSRVGLKHAAAPKSTSVSADESVAAVIQAEGESAYAHRQAVLQRNLRTSFEKEWSELPRFIAEARRRAGTLAADDSEVPSEITNEQEEDIDGPIPLGPRRILGVIDE